MWKIWLWFKEATEGIFRNATINIFAASLSLLSFFVLAFWIVVAINIQYQSQTIENNLQISVNLSEEAEDYEGISTKLEELDGVKSVQFVSKEEAYETTMKDLGDREDMLSGLGFNPLPAQFQLKVENPEEIKLIAKKIETWGVTKSIKYGENYIDRLFEATENLEKVILIILAVMIISTGAMVYVSIRLNILNRNKELEIKDLIGAGKINIRLPFIIEGMLLTSITAGIILGIVYVFYEKMAENIMNVYPGTSMVGKEEIMASLIPILLIIAISIGVISSFLSTQKYLKRH